MISTVSLDKHRCSFEAKVRGDRRHRIDESETKKQEKKGRNDNMNTKTEYKEYLVNDKEGEEPSRMGKGIHFSKSNLLSCKSEERG